MNRPLASLLALLRRATSPSPSALARTPHEAIWHENKWRLLRFAPSQPRFATPILIVPSLINRWYVLDLAPGRSLIEFLVGCGHDVYCIDWGTPGDEDRYLTWDDFAGRYLVRALGVTTRTSSAPAAHVLGYCLGGTLAVTHAAALHASRARIATLATLAAPIEFAHAGVMAAWTRSASFDPRAIVDAFGNVPWPLLQASFHSLRPTATSAKLVSLLDRAWDDEFLDGFLATEYWGNDNVSFPGACYARYLQELYREDRLVAGTFTVLGERARLAAIACPVLAVAFTDDHIVPPASARPLVEHVGARDKRLVELRGGHVGAVVARKAASGLWRELAQFWAERD